MSLKRQQDAATLRAFTESARQTVVITDTGNQNNYAPGGAALWKRTWWVTLNAGAGGDYDITGFDASGRNDDDFVFVKFVQNIGSSKTITLKHLDGLSTLENQIEMPDSKDLVIGVDGLVVLVYSLEDVVWRPMNPSSAWLSKWTSQGTLLVKDTAGNVVPVGQPNQILARVDTSPGTGMKTYTREYIEHILRAQGRFTNTTASGTIASHGGVDWNLLWHQRFQPTGDLTVQSFVADSNNVQFTHVKLLTNDGTGRLILEHESSETASNRIKCPNNENYVLGPGESVYLAYDGTELRWRPVGPYRQSAELNAQTGTTYTILASDDGKHVKLSNASSIAVTVPNGLPTGFACLLTQIGAGQVTVSGGATLSNPDSELSTRLQFSTISLTQYLANSYIVGGDTA